MTTPLESWIFHIIAGILGVLFSLSIVYMKFEQKFSVHQKLDPDAIRRIGNGVCPFSADEQKRFISWFNGLNYLGTNTKYLADFSDATVVECANGNQLYVAKGDKFIEVKRVDKKGKTKYYWLLDKDADDAFTGRT